jgi:uncharacterized protein YuzE
MRTSYDSSTDSLYIEVRPLRSARTVEIEVEVMLDLGSDGEPVGYDIQHASTKAEFIGQLIVGKAPSETLHLLGNRANAGHLLKSIRAANAGRLATGRGLTKRPR